jgi:hypothetical protein
MCLFFICQTSTRYQKKGSGRKNNGGLFAPLHLPSYANVQSYHLFCYQQEIAQSFLIQPCD